MNRTLQLLLIAAAVTGCKAEPSRSQVDKRLRTVNAITQGDRETAVRDLCRYVGEASSPGGQDNAQVAIRGLVDVYVSTGDESILRGLDPSLLKNGLNADLCESLEKLVTVSCKARQSFAASGDLGGQLQACDGVTFKEKKVKEVLTQPCGER